MTEFREYWTFSAIRGALAMVASVAVWAMPQAASSILSLPVLVALAVDCFAVYSLFNGVVAILLAKLLPARGEGRKGLYGEAAMGMVTGAMLFLVVYGAVPPMAAIWAAAVQAAVSAVCEWKVARETHAQYGCASCYSTAIVLAVSAVCLPLASGQDAAGMALALATYAGLFGASELALGARMLLLEYREAHPVAAFSTDWRTPMTEAAATQPLFATAEAAPATGSICAACPAEATCSDNSTAGRLAEVMAQRAPLLVKTVRAAALLQGAQARSVPPAAARMVPRRMA